MSTSTPPQFGRVVQTKNGHVCVVHPAEVLENPLATDTTHRVLTRGIQRIFLPRSAAGNGRESINISGRENRDSAVLVSVRNESWQERIRRPSQPLLAR